jgi:septum formation protein
MARAKAAAVESPGSVVLAADTVVACGRRILPKAGGVEEARACLDLLSGRRHNVLGAVCVIGPDGQRRERLVTSVVRFKRLSPTEIDIYISSGEWRGKAGGYAIQGSAAAFVPFLSGSYSNVVGLPLFEVTQMLRAGGWLS